MTRSRALLAALSSVLIIGGMVAGCSHTPAGSGPAGAPASPAATAASEAPTSAAKAPADVPLPPGPWRTAYSGGQEVARGNSERTILVSASQGVIDRVVLIYRVHLGLRYEFLPRASCRDPSYYYQVIDERTEGAGFCWQVRAVNFGLAGDPHWVNRVLADDAERHDLFLPVVMPGVRFIRYAEGEMLQVDYLWNADLLVPAPAGHVWLPDDWTNEAIAGDPGRQAVMQTLRRWGEDWQARLAAAPGP